MEHSLIAIQLEENTNLHTTKIKDKLYNYPRPYVTKIKFKVQTYQSRNTQLSYKKITLDMREQQRIFMKVILPGDCQGVLVG